jgi:DNA-directed RNA polymerase specialized sigma24 family protein
MTATPGGPARNRRSLSPGGTVRGFGRGAGEPAGQAISSGDVHAALARLSAQDRQVIIEIYFRNRPVPEVADLLQIPVTAVLWRAYSAVRELAQSTAAAGTGPRTRRRWPARPA